MNPGSAAQSLGDRAMALQASGHHEKAVEMVRLHLRVRPRDSMAMSVMGVLLRGAGALEESERWLRRAVAVDPANVAAIHNLGTTLSEARREAEAIAQWELAARLQPLFPLPWIALAAAYAQVNEAERGIEAGNVAVRLVPGEPGAHANLALALCRAGRTEEACDAYRRLAERVAPDPRVHSDYLLTLNYLARPTADVLEAHRAFGRACQARRPAAATDPSPDRPIRLGILSGDLHDHSVGFFAESLVSGRPAGIEAVAFATTVCPASDAAGARIRRLFDRVVEASSLSDAALDEAIRAERIDVLVELSGHTGGNRLAALASKPAPVIISAIGYPNTTGLPAVDWRLVDSITDPPGAETLCTERLLRLDPCFLCYRPPELEVAPAMPGGGPVTFGSFNNSAKIGPECAALWAKVLQAVPGSRLLLKTQTLADPAAQRELRRRLESAGIAPDTVELIAWSPTRAEHLAIYGRVHVALDSVPYNGTTTTCEALWMGVPVVAIRGDRHASRVSASLLSAAGHPEWIAEDEDGFVRIAAALAGDPTRLASIRSSLRAELRASPLLDQRGFAQRFHAAIRGCWQDWCARQAPKGA
jgi:protein O-GlcNAc transferase